jgi:hypothetical protein
MEQEYLNKKRINPKLTKKESIVLQMIMMANG